MSQYIDTATGSVRDRSESFVKCPKCVVAAVTFAVALGAAAFILVSGQSPTVDETAVAQVQGALSGYQYETDATAGRIAGPGVTSGFHGQNGELWPTAVAGSGVQGALSGYQYETDATAGRIAGPGVASGFHGQNGELWPEATTSVVSAEYLGGSRVLSPETIAKTRANDMVEYFASQAVLGVSAEYLGGSRVLSPEAIAKVRANDMVEHFASQAVLGVSAEYLGGSRVLSSEAIARIRANDMVEFFASQALTVASAEELSDKRILAASGSRPASQAASGEELSDKRIQAEPAPKTQRPMPEFK